MYSKKMIFSIILTVTLTFSIVYVYFFKDFTTKIDYGNFVKDLTTEIDYYILDTEPALYIDEKSADTHIICTDDGLKYDYFNFPNEHNITMDRECLEDFQLDDNLTILSFKDHDMNHHHLDEHIEDQLIYLDKETLKASVLYKSAKHCRILYGNQDYCLIYNANKNVFQYIKLDSGLILKAIPAQIKTRGHDYLFEYDLKNEEIIIYSHSIKGIKELTKISTIIE